MPLFSLITDVLGGVKDRATEGSAKAYINRKIQNFGQVTRISIDSRQKTVEIEVVLKGEAAPIWLKVCSYEVADRGSEAFIRINGVEASREWIGLALSEYVVGRDFTVPQVVRMAL